VIIKRKIFYDLFNTLISFFLLRNRILCSIFLTFHLQSNAQQPSYFTFAEKQLEGVDIYDVIQDKKNQYWISTDHGIYKHDGYTFQKIDCEEMKSSSVFNFVMDQEGTIYCNNFNYQIFQIKNNKCKLYLDVSNLNLKNDVSIKLTKQEDLIVYSSNVYVFEKYTKKIKAVSNESDDTFLSPAFTLRDGSIIFHRVGTYKLLHYKNGIILNKNYSINQPNQKLTILDFYRFNDKSNVVIDRVMKKIYTFDEEKFVFNFVKDLPKNLNAEHLRTYYSKDQLWVASSISGVLVYDKNLNKLYSESKIYEDYFISDVTQDNEGNVLVSTFDKGILVIPDLNIPDVNSELANYSISRISSNNQGTMYFGTSKGQILSLNNSEIKELYSKAYKVIETLHYSKGQSILFFDDLGLSYIDFKNKKKFQENIGSIKDIFELDSTTLYISLNIGVFKLKFINKNKRFEFTNIKKLKGRTNAISGEKKYRNIYVASNDGLKMVDKNENVKAIKLKGKKVYVTDFTEMNDIVLASTLKNGILFLSGGKIRKQITPAFLNELLEIYRIKYKKDKIFANTNIGLIILNLEGEIYQILNKSFGVSTNKIIDFYIDENNLWIAQSRGVQKINLNAIQKTKNKPKIYISSILVNNNIIKSTKKSFSANEKKITFNLFVPTMKYRESINYLYKLSGNDIAWNRSIYEDNSVIYNALSPGNYTFYYRADNNGLLGPIKQFKFSIDKPYYQKWWFILLLFILVTSLLSLFYRVKLKRQAKVAFQINELNSLKLMAIQSQMNPHFIFNSLNSIQDLVLKGDIDNSYIFITKFSNLVRKTLNYSEKDFIEFDQELELIELYLSLEKLRFKENFNFSIHTNQIEDIQIPPMLIQPFLENAIHHGLLHKEGEKQLSIKFQLDRYLICEIIDNGVGRKKSKEIKERQRAEHESFALLAIKKRFDILQTQFEEKIGFSFVDLENNGIDIGTKVILKIPIKQRF
jgi:hypothetical protein